MNQKLRRHRRYRDLTQRQLAIMVGVKEMTISHFETGRSIPDPNTARRISECLGVSVEELFDEGCAA
ncbi:MAG: helix-turn-helix domain-containing protein [Candidatus Marinimicrobia bacterium]|nr:helix-turn-helix domain-containing protein [Candidatus Neomarinimicrobiota bacterium]